MLHVVSVTSVAPPTIAWRCPRCPCSELVCSERFRINANAKLADIWLIYRCARCDATKNLTIVERKPITRISRSLLDAATTNDPVAARHFARDLHLLRSAGVRVLRGDRFSLSATALGAARVQLRFAEPLLVRADHVLGMALGLSRRRLRALDAADRLRLDPPAPLSRLRLTTTTEVSIDPDQTWFEVSFGAEGRRGFGRSR